MIVAMNVARMAALRMLVGHDASPGDCCYRMPTLRCSPRMNAVDISDLVRRQPGDGRRVAELPVVGARTVRDRQLKGDIGVMTGFVDLIGAWAAPCPSP